MALSTEPLSPITQEHTDVYNRDGVVCLRNVINQEWVDLLDPVARKMLIDKQDFGLLPSLPGRYMARCIPEFRKLVFESGIAQACGQVLESKEIRFFFDEIFAKPAQSDAKTIWHADRMGWPVEGMMVPSLWVPITPITKKNSLEVIAGSHTEDKKYWLFSANARKMIKPDDRDTHPDCEPLRGDGKTEFLTWDMNPGDMLIVHPRALHYSSGNPTDDWRIALSMRVFGDDIRWQPRPDCVNIAGVSWDEMLEGEKPAGSHFPLLWSEHGDADDDSSYPRGFATSWSAQPMRKINEYDLFKKLSEEAHKASS